MQAYLFIIYLPVFGLPKALFGGRGFDILAGLLSFHLYAPEEVFGADEDGDLLSTLSL